MRFQQGVEERPTRLPISATECEASCWRRARILRSMASMALGSVSANKCAGALACRFISLGGGVFPALSRKLFYRKGKWSVPVAARTQQERQPIRAFAGSSTPPYRVAEKIGGRRHANTTRNAGSGECRRERSLGD